MDLQIAGSVGTIERAFHVTINRYNDTAANRTFYAPDREPTVNLPFKLWHISGLDNYSVPVPLVQRRASNDRPLAMTGSCPQESFCGRDMRAAY
jgi:subtilase family serine protease